ncbi:exonuclease SbcCD subunit D [uncultured Phascolarctobacterium sp.]|uniref:exonuclease SbcCD subunit D n=1 Tax=uncultured Phascolarctobacterium sp. TaxID=512296 RepID=UPI0025F5E161|nr:exonuclease SbcCD subunit D [uncultured Phascolarctobacterium sp.]
MKLMHLSDLHLGKRLNEFSLLEDQCFILQQLVELVRSEQPDCVLLAGDIYDKPVPPAEAVTLFDDFLNKLAQLTTVCVTSGNHDSAERLAFGAQLMREGGVHFCGLYTGEPQCVTLQDAYGSVHIYLLPFLKPAHVRHCLTPEEAEQVTTYHEALRCAVERLHINAAERNVLVAHQFVTGAQTAGSEAVNVGGVDNIGAEVFAAFDYTALGHIHKAQNVGSERVRYSGTPLKYSFAEWQQEKSVTLVELGEKGRVSVTALPLAPLRDLRKLRGSYEELMSKDFYDELPKDSDGLLRDFYHLTLTDEEDVPDAVQKLRSVYKNLLQLEYDNKRTRTDNAIEGAERVVEKSPLELMEEFYQLQNNQALSEKQRAYLQSLLEKEESR